MTISSERRRQDALALLALLYAKLGDNPIDLSMFNPADKCFSTIQTTSWDELVSQGLLLRREGALHFLTARGWSEALIRSGDSNKPDFKQRVGRLSKTLKDKVKGRQSAALLSLDYVAGCSNLPPGWTFNVIDSHLIARIQGKRDAGWLEGARGRLIEVPRDFGLVEIDLFADVRSENLRLTEQVEQMEELYSDFRCDLCSAPLISRIPWDHEYGTDEVMEYECGMTIGAPYGDVPCTRDPKFPKFEDYVLITRREGESWRCYAHAAENSSSPARIVTLLETSGFTEDEAKEAMRQRYSDRAKHWRR